MKVSKWVDFGQEVEVEIDFNDVRIALAEAFSSVADDRFLEPPASKNDVLYAFNSIGTFFRAVTDEQIGMLNEAQHKTIATFLTEQATRFELSAIPIEKEPSR